MKNILAALIGCTLGASVSGIVTYKITKKKCLKLTNKELDDMNNYYQDKINELNKSIEVLSEANNSKDKVLKLEDKAKEVPKKKGGRPKKDSLPDQQVSSIEKPKSDKKYTDYTKKYTSEEVEGSKGTTNRDSIIETKVDGQQTIEVIAPEDYGDKFFGYYKDTLYYYQDGVLADENDNIVLDIPGTIGTEALETFGRYEEDRVCVRNHKLEQDYEIYLSLRNFQQIMDSKGESESPEDE